VLFLFLEGRNWQLSSLSFGAYCQII